MTLEKRLYREVLIFAMFLSIFAVVGNLFAHFDVQVNYKWLALFSISLIAYISEKKNKYSYLSMRIFIYFLIFGFLPFAFIDSGGSQNNALGYTFLMFVVISYLFKGKEQVFILSKLLGVFLTLVSLEYFHPELVASHSRFSQYVDRMIQVPIQLIALFFIVRLFSGVYQKSIADVEKKNKEVMNAKLYLEKSNENLAYANRKLKESNLKLEDSKTELERVNKELLESNVRLEESEEWYKHLSITDNLTQIYNRMKIDETLEEEIARTKRTKRTFCVIMFDIDHFKLVNDKYGHQVGDSVLVAIARLIKSSIREIDTFGRWGGEEFLIVLPEVQLPSALVAAERLRKKIESHIFETVEKITCSFGVTEYDIEETPNKLIRRVDTALYKAKENGRNRTEC